MKTAICRLLAVLAVAAAAAAHAQSYPSKPGASKLQAFAGAAMTSKLANEQLAVYTRIVKEAKITSD